MTRMLAALLLSLAATATCASEAANIRASAAWIRVLPGDLPAGGYVTLQNPSTQPATLVGASSPSYGMAMLHESSRAGGMNRMRMVEKLVIPAHGSQMLAPGGYHLMLMHAKTPVAPGATVRITLTFADGSALPVDFAARPAGALGPHD
ncbi:MAG: copper chaperone PCu(A)C [Rhodanobacter sp.]|nr:MAG: copper chaperone PCu(A)C [Rhodanobacter sp.]TAM14516.1 MAG: copper chaperone PCu(A)C [Rhodanobacter sp.]TAM37307.1 MAG: copper chaperone PCu(A)C [Rhodanobacter sp.]